MYFYRAKFNSGVCYITDRVNGRFFKRTFKAYDNGKMVHVNDEKYVLKEYPKFFFRTKEDMEEYKRSLVSI